MATHLIPNSATQTLPLLTAWTPPSRASFNPQLRHVPTSLVPIRHSSTEEHRIMMMMRPNKRGLTMVTRAGPTATTYVFAFVFPLSLLAVTIFTSIRIADKLDNDFLEELEINEAIREAYEDDHDDGNDANADDKEGMSLEEEQLLLQQTVLPRTRTRNRPKREA